MSKRNHKNNAGFRKIIGMVQGIDRMFLPITIVEQIIASALPFVNIILGAKIIDKLSAYGGNTMDNDENSIIWLALIMVGLNMVLALARWSLNKVLIIKKRRIDDMVTLKVTDKALTLDYQIMEKEETLDYIHKAEEGSNSHGGITSYCSMLANITASIVTIIYGAVILAGFVAGRMEKQPEGVFESFINSYWSGAAMIALISLAILYNMYIFDKINKLQYKFFEENVRGNRQFGYFFRSFLYDYTSGKTVRIYDMGKYILKKMNQRKENLSAEQIATSRRMTFFAGQGELVSAIFMFISYLFVGVKAVYGIISIGMLTMYVGALTRFTDGFINMCWQLSQYSIQGKYLSNYVEFLNIKNEKYEGTLPIEKRLDNDYELEFKNVSFHYPNSEDMILKNVTAKIRVGKKMAIVGKNGAGKSTFIKLLCRLYDPSEGEILLNGIDIRKYDYDEYRDIFGVVFQDFQLFSFSVAQNVAAGVRYDEAKVWKCLMQAGMKDRVEAMDKGIDTIIYKQEDEGVEISGGEAQKLAIARALYKDAPVVILDEPTAALDPVSELEIYERFDEMVNEKTAIYISHRMSSCRFCENIVVFDEGSIVQMGSHESLVGEEGLYRELWQAQSQYYKN